MDAYSHRQAIGRRFGERIAAEDAVFQTGAAELGGLPFTVTDGVSREFSGANLFVLMQVMKDYGWSDPRFFTLKQIKQEGWELSSGPIGGKIALQFMQSTGDDGLPLETPVAKRVQVYNASEIDGVPALEAKTRAGVTPVDFVLAAINSGAIWIDTYGLNFGLHKWVFDLQKAALEDGVVIDAGMTLRSKLAVSLLEAQTGIVFDNYYGGVFESSAEVWAQGIEADPFSFFAAARDAEKLSATVMKEVRAVMLERETVEALEETTESVLPVLELESVAAPNAVEEVVVAAAPAEQAAPVEPVAGTKKRVAARVEALFAERLAVLAVPYADKDRANKLGAVWHSGQGMWFVPPGLDVELFKEWNPRSHSLGPVATRDVLINSFRDAMADMGLDASGDILDDGKWHYASVDTKKNAKANKAGSYIVSMDGARDGGAIGTIINRDSGEQVTWRHEGGGLLTPEQRAKLRADALAKEASAAQELAVLQDVAAGHANEIWSVAGAVDDQGYAALKGISTDGLRQVSGAVLKQYPEFVSDNGGSAIRSKETYTLVPLMNAAGEIRSLQAISADGKVKSFMRADLGGQKKGMMMVLGAASFDALASMDVPAIAYVEGLSTGKSLHVASGMPVVVCFDAGNLEIVVPATSGKLPREMLRVLAVDNDQFHVERALGFLSDKMGLNPHAVGGLVVSVVDKSLNFNLRSVQLGEVVADGQWHEGPKGSYCVTLSKDDEDDAVRYLHVEIVPTGGRKSSAVFANRGVEAGRVAMGAIDVNSKVVIVAPEFKSLVGRPTDWNDLVNVEGFNAVRSVLRDAGLSIGHERSEGLAVKERVVENPITAYYTDRANSGQAALSR